MTIIFFIRTRSGHSYYTKHINFTQGAIIGVEFIDVRNRAEVFIACSNLSHITICDEIKSENDPYPIFKKYESTHDEKDDLPF